MALAEQHGLQRVRVDALVLLASVEWDLGNYPSSESLAGRAERQATAESYEDGVIRALKPLGWAQYYQAKYAEAEATARRTENLSSRDSEEKYGALRLLGLVYGAQGDYVRALDMHEKALRIRRKVFGEDHPKTALTKRYIQDVCKAGHKPACK